MLHHPEKRLRRAALRQIGALETEVGFDIKVIRGVVRQPRRHPPPTTRRCCTPSSARSPRLSDHLVVIFDEFQRLRHCPGDPLAIIRSALMSAGANHVSLLLTGSIRNALQMMLESSEQPIFGEAAQLQLPAIAVADFLEYLDFQFEATGKPADDEALTYLLSATRAHPRSTQQLAWRCWSDTPAGHPVTLETVAHAHDQLVQTIERSEFSATLNVLMSGEESEVNEVRALQLVADRGGDNVTSRPLATRYGFSSHSRVPSSLLRLQRRGSRRSARRRLVHRRSAVRRVAAARVPPGRELTVPLTGYVFVPCMGYSEMRPDPRSLAAWTWLALLGCSRLQPPGGQSTKGGTGERDDRRGSDRTVRRWFGGRRAGL